MIKKIIELTPLLLIIALAFFTRLYRIDSPLADWHSFRQADTASVTREYVKNGINLLLPKYHDLSNIQSGRDNPEGLRMVEAPLLNAVTAAIIRHFDLLSQEVLVGRLVSVFLSLVTLISIYLLAYNLTGKTTAIVSALTFAILPYSIYYSRVILPEPALLAMATLSLSSFLLFAKNNCWHFLILSLLSFTLALLLKPFAIFLAPVFLAIAVFYYGTKVSRYWPLLLFAVTITPILWWRNWITAFPEGTPASDWLYNKGNIRFKGAFFHWLFEVRISTLILGIGGVFPLVLGLIQRGKDWFVYGTWFVCGLIYLSVFAGGNVQHDYYQVFLLPIICLLVGRGVSLMLSLPKSLVRRPVAIASLLVLTAFSLFVSWYTVRGYFVVNHWEIVEAGRAVDRLVPRDAKVIAPYNGDTAFLFQTNRTGWPIGYYIEEKIKAGATHYVSVNFDEETNDLKKKYQIVSENEKYIILNLKQSL